MQNSKVNSVCEPTILYAGCSELPLYRWIKLACTGDHKWLIKSGPVIDVSDQYAAIYAEYQTLVKDTRSSQELTLKIGIVQLANRIDVIKICIHQLRIERDERIIEILHKLGFTRLKYIDLEKDLKLTETYCQSDVVKLTQKQNQYTKMVGEIDGNGTAESDFYNQISIIEKWKGSAIDVHSYSVMHWVSDLNNLKAEIREAEKNRK